MKAFRFVLHLCSVHGSLTQPNVCYTHTCVNWKKKTMWKMTKKTHDRIQPVCARAWAVEHMYGSSLYYTQWQYSNNSWLYKWVRTQYHFSFSLLCCPRNNLHAADIDRVSKKGEKERNRNEQRKKKQNDFRVANREKNETDFFREKTKF